MTDLNDLIDPASGCTLTRAIAINDAGQILAWGDNGDLHSNALVLSVPEPGTMTILVAGLLALAQRRRQRRGSV